MLFYVFLFIVNKKEAECLIQEFNVLMGEPTNSGRAVQGLDRGKFIVVLHNVFGLTDDMITGRGILFAVILLAAKLRKRIRTSIYSENLQLRKNVSLFPVWWQHLKKTLQQGHV